MKFLTAESRCSLSSGLLGRLLTHWNWMQVTSSAKAGTTCSHDLWYKWMIFFSPFYQCLICCHFSPVFYIISRRCGSLRHHFDELPPPDDHIKSHSSFISSLFARMDPYHVPLSAAKHYSLFSLNHVLTNELFVYIICNCQYEGHSVY